MRLLILSIMLTGFYFASASDLSESLLSAYQKIPDLQLMIQENYFAKKLYLTEFLVRNGGYECYEKNRSQLDTLCSAVNAEAEVKKMLEKSVIDKDFVKKAMKEFKFPAEVSGQQDIFEREINYLIDELRVPEADGTYRYARYVKKVSSSADRQELRAQHGLPQYQKYEKSFSEKIFRIHIFSPSKIGMFGGNCDSYLGKLSVQYKKDDQTKNVVQSYDRILKRGESVDFELPEIAESATVTLTFSCKPEHRGKAYLYIEPQCASLADDTDSPYYNLIHRIRNFSFSGSSDTVLQNLSSLSDEILEAYSCSVNSVKTSKTVKEKFPDDSVQYFYYMLSDPAVSRTALQEKYKSIFMDQN